MNHTIGVRKLREGFWVATLDGNTAKTRAGETEAEAVANVKAAYMDEMPRAKGLEVGR